MNTVTFSLIYCAGGSTFYRFEEVACKRQLSKNKTEHCCKGDQWREKLIFWLNMHLDTKWPWWYDTIPADDILLGKVHNWKSTCLVDTTCVLDFRNKKSLMGICRWKGWLVLVSRSTKVFCYPYLTVREIFKVWNIYGRFTVLTTDKTVAIVATVRQYWGSYSEYKENTFGLHQFFLPGWVYHTLTFYNDLKS